MYCNGQAGAELGQAQDKLAVLVDVVVVFIVVVVVVVAVGVVVEDGVYCQINLSHLSDGWLVGWVGGWIN